jgi:hypothetical protein
MMNWEAVFKFLFSWAIGAAILGQFIYWVGV